MSELPANLTEVIVPIYGKAIPPIAHECVNRLLSTSNIVLHLPVTDLSQPKNVNLITPTSKYFVIVDWDVLVPDGWLEPLLEIMEANEDCGILGVKMHGNYQGANATVPAGETQEVDNVAGGLMVCRNVGLKWDEEYPSGYFCDTDFCHQYREMGLKVLLTGVVDVQHDTQGSGMTVENYEAGKQRFIEKWSRDKVGDKVAVCILSWNQLDTVKMSVEAARADDLEVWVVDNGSTDGTQDYLKTLKGVNVVQFARNMGISYARNRVIERFTKDYLLFLDGDIVYIPDSARHMLFELTCLPPQTYCLGIHSMVNGADVWDGFTLEEADKRWTRTGEVRNDIAEAWTQYGLFKGDIIRKYKFPEYGVFYGPGWGFEDDWINAKLEEDGYVPAYCTGPKYYHKNAHASMDASAKEAGCDIHHLRREELERRFPNYVHWTKRPRAAS